MRNGSRHGAAHQDEVANACIYNLHHTAPVDERPRFAGTFCGILYRATCIGLYVLNIKHVPPPCASFSALPTVYGMMGTRIRLQTEHLARRTRSGLCRGGGSSDCPATPAGPPDVSHPPVAVSARRRAPGRTQRRAH